MVLYHQGLSIVGYNIGLQCYAILYYTIVAAIAQNTLLQSKEKSQEIMQP